MRPTDGADGTPPISTEEPPADPPAAAPVPASSTSPTAITATTADTTSTTTDSGAAPTLDIFGGKALSLSLCLSLHYKKEKVALDLDGDDELNRLTFFSIFLHTFPSVPDYFWQSKHLDLLCSMKIRSKIRLGEDNNLF